jgi:hypothetical protein
VGEGAVAAGRHWHSVARGRCGREGSFRDVVWCGAEFPLRSS